MGSSLISRNYNNPPNRPLAKSPADLVTIGIACGRVSDREIIPKVRQLLQGLPQPEWARLVKGVTQIPSSSNSPFPSLADSLSWLNANPSCRLLIAGDSVAMDWSSLGAIDTFHGELIVAANIRTSPRLIGSVHPSVLRRGNFSMSFDLIEPIRKAVKRLSVKALGAARIIESSAELDKYLRLRFIVWNANSYMNPNRTPSLYPAEVDFTDRTAIPVGFFRTTGELVGCVRLVKEIGNEETRYVRLIQEIVDRSKDPIIANNFKMPQRLTHPFDILQEFEGFQKYYSDLVKARISVGEVSRVAVLPEFERRGIAEALVDCVVDLAAQQKVKKLILACPESHINLYKRSGFAVLPTIRSDRFLHIAQPSVIMELNVTNN
jgi:ribosomal protein S18 acetylase RimI-like enzyme